jgi:uncharacterized membrane protein
VSRRTAYFHHSLSFYVFFVILIFVVLVLISTDVIRTTFEAVGFTPLTIVLALVACLIGSSINIPLYKVETKGPIVRDEYVRWLGITYRIPLVSYGEVSTQVAVNVGGALIPTSLSVFLLTISSVSIVTLSLIGVLVVTIVTHLVARPVRGVGVVSPVFISPLVAAVSAVLLSPAHPVIVAYVAGTLGTLIGADLMNLGKIPALGAPVASIGGAGTFDGVFLTGIIAALIAAL